MIHELFDPASKAKRNSSSKTITFSKPRFSFDNHSCEGSEHSNKGSTSTIYISPWLRNNFGQRNKLQYGTLNSRTDLKPFKITLKDSFQSDADSYKSTISREISRKPSARKDASETVPHDQRQQVHKTQSSELRVLDLTNVHDSPPCPEICRKKSSSVHKKPSKKEKSGIPTTATSKDDGLNPKLMSTKSKCRRRIPCRTKQPKVIEKGSGMEFILEMRGRRTLESCRTSEKLSFSSERTTKSHDLAHSKLNEMKQEAKSNVLYEEKDSKQMEGENMKVEKAEENEKCTKEHPQKCNETQTESLQISTEERNIKEVSESLNKKSKGLNEKNVEGKDEKCTKEVWGKEALKDVLADDETVIYRLSESLYKNKNLEEKKKCLLEMKDYFERKKKTRETRNRICEEIIEIPEKKEKNSKGYLKLCRVKDSKYISCNECVVEKAVDEALQKFVEIYHFHVTPGVMESMKKNIMLALTTNSESNNNSSKLKEVENECLDLSEIRAKKVDMLKNVRTSTKLLSKDNIFGKHCESSSTISLKREIDKFLKFIRSSMDVTNLKVRSIILEEKEKSLASEKLQFVCNFANKEVLRVRQSKHGETQTVPVPETPKRDVELQVHCWGGNTLEEDLISKKPTCNITNRQEKHKAIQTEAGVFKKSVYVQVHESKDEKNVKTEMPTCKVLSMEKDKELRHKEIQTESWSEVLKKNVKLQVCAMKENLCEKNLGTDNSTCTSRITQTDLGSTTSILREVKNLNSCNMQSGMCKLIKSMKTGKLYLYQECHGGSSSSEVKGKPFYGKRKVGNVLSKEGTKSKKYFLEEKERMKRKIIKQEKKQEEVEEDSINYLYFRNFDKKSSDSDLDLIDVESITEQPHLVKQDLSGHYWLWDGERISPGCDLKIQVENLLAEKLQLMYDNASEAFLNSVSLLQKQDDGGLQQRTISERTYNVSVKQDTETHPQIQSQDDITEERKCESKKEEAVELSRKKSVKSVKNENSDWGYVSMYLSKLKSFGTRTGVKGNCSRTNRVRSSSHQMMNNLTEAEDLLVAVENIRKMNLEILNTNLSECDSNPLIGDKNGGSKPVGDYQCSNSGSGRTWVQRAELNNTWSRLQMNRKNRLGLIETAFKKVDKQVKKNLLKEIRKIMKTKMGKDNVKGDSVGEVYIEIDHDILKTAEGGIEPSIMTNPQSSNCPELEVEVDLTLEDLEHLIRQNRKKCKKRIQRNGSRNLKSSSSNHTEYKKAAQRSRRHRRRFTGHKLAKCDTLENI